MADADYVSKGSTKVEEKFKGTNWPTFSLEMKSIFYHLRVDELIYERKARTARSLDNTTPEGKVQEKAYQDWVRQDKTAQAAIRQNTAMTHNSYVHRDDHDSALKIWDHLQNVFRLSGPTAQDNARRKWQNMSMGKLTAVAYNVQVNAHLAESARVGVYL